MLLELKFKNFLLIEEAHLSFAPGFTVLTGETGAGKSLLMQGLALLLGARISPHLLKDKDKDISIEALFYGGPELASKMELMGLDPAEEILIRRIISPSKSRIYINGSPATLQMLSRLTADLVLLASQHEHQRLSNPEDRLSLLDSFAHLEKEVSRYQKLFSKYQELKGLYEQRKKERENWEREKDFLLFQIREIEEAQLKEGEEEKLLEERKFLRHISKIRSLLENSIIGLEKSLDFLGPSEKALKEASSWEEGLKQPSKRLEELFYELEDILFLLKDRLPHLHPDEDRLEEIETRLYKLSQLKRKYGSTIEEILNNLEKWKKEYSQKEDSQEELNKFKKDLELLKKQLLEQALFLSQRRKKAAKELSQKVTSLLSSLGMEGASFLVKVISEEDNLRAKGLDRIDFMVSTNPNSSWAPLSKVASGGELSRIFLALKTVLSHKAGTQVLIFDEIDAGIGGVTATKVAHLLKELARYQQVICITHLPQIASLAEHHFVVEKRLLPEGAKTFIRKLSSEERLLELSRMLGQEEDLDLAKKLIKR